MWTAGACDFELTILHEETDTEDLMPAALLHRLSQVSSTTPLTTLTYTALTFHTLTYTALTFHTLTLRSLTPAALLRRLSQELPYGTMRLQRCARHLKLLPGRSLEFKVRSPPTSPSWAPPHTHRHGTPPDPVDPPLPSPSPL